MDSKEVKQHAIGHWQEIIPRVSGLAIELLDSKPHGCPKCGGRDRFRALNDFDKTGGVICNQCFNKSSGNHFDGFSTLQWITGQGFPETISAVKNFLGLKDKPKKKSRPKGELNFDSIEWRPLEPGVVSLFLAKKQPLNFESIKAVGGRFAIYQRTYPVIMVPVWGEFLQAADPCGWIMYAANGGPLYLKDGEAVKLKMLPGTKPGVIINTNVIKNLNDIPNKLLKVEGPTDVMAMLSLNQNLPVFTNSNGAGETPKDQHKRLVSGCELSIIHDADKPGQDGLETWSTELAKSTTLVRKLHLPYETVPNHGKDLRDWLNEGNGAAEFKALIENAEVIEGKGEYSPEESNDIYEVDDPDRLARLNLAKYEEQIGGRVVYHKGSLYKWTKNRPYYSELSTEEFIAKARPVIRTEFIAEQQSTNRKRVRAITNTLMSNIVKATESQALISGSKNMPFWIKNDHPLSGRRCLSFDNGLLDIEQAADTHPDLRNQIVHPHTPDWFSMSCIPTTHDAYAQCPKWIDYLLKVMENDGQRMSLLQEWFGYLLLGSPRFQKCLLLYGEGSNGKSVLLAGMRAMLGPQNYSTLAIEDLNKDFELAHLHGKLANITADMNEVDSVAEGVIKAITSGDPVHAKVKYKSGITMIPTARLVFATNTLPRIADRSQGIWRRLCVIPFRYKVKKEERIYGMDTEEYWKDELPGMVTWAIGGLSRLLKNNRFSDSTVCDNEIRRYREDSNPLEGFLQSHLEPDLDQYVVMKDLYKTYREWCNENGYRSMNNANLGREVCRMFESSEGFSRSRRRVDGVISHCFEGLKLIQSDVFKGSSDPIIEEGDTDDISNY